MDDLAAAKIVAISRFINSSFSLTHLEHWYEMLVAGEGYHAGRGRCLQINAFSTQMEENHLVYHQDWYAQLLIDLYHTGIYRL